MPDWNVRVTFCPFPVEVLDEDDDKIEKLMSLTGRTLSWDGVLKSFNITWNEETETLDEVSRTAADRARAHLGEIGHGSEPIARIEIRDHEQPTEMSDLERQSVIAFWLGVSRQRVAQLSKKDPDFPRVAMWLRDGTPLYRPMDVMRYVERRKERLGKAD